MSIARHTIYNVVGAALPALLALVTVPAYLALVGNERYGILAIAWLVLGYFGVFDLGLGRATAQRVASLHGESAQVRASAFGTAIVANLLVGLFGAAIMWPMASYLLTHWMVIPPGLRGELGLVPALLALSVPIATSIGVLSGALMGRERFFEINRTNVTTTALFQLLPLAYAWVWGPNLTNLMVAAIAARLLGMLMFWRMCAREFGAGAVFGFDRTQLRALMGDGGWVTVTGVFAPLLAVADRFVIGHVQGPAQVTQYSVPVRLVTRLSMLSSALGSATFPRYASIGDAERADMSRKAVSTLFVVMTPVTVTLLFGMGALMHLWVGNRLGPEAVAVGRLWLIAVWINCFAQIPYSQLEAIGKPHLVGASIAIQAAPYAILLFLVVRWFGIIGAAWLNLIRGFLDTVILNYLCYRRFIMGRVLSLLILVFVGIAIVMGMVPAGFVVQIALAALALPVVLAFQYFALREMIEALWRTLKLSRR